MEKADRKIGEKMKREGDESGIVSWFLSRLNGGIFT